jgi:hypothetical protein
MTRTLYKAKKPTSFDDGEYYQPTIDFQFLNGKQQYFVRETHGYWNDNEKRVIHVLTTLSPEEGYSTFQEADQRYQQQLQKRVGDGFVHSFSLDPCRLSGDYISYEYLGDQK